MNHCFAGIGLEFEVFAKPSVTLKPCESPLYHPPLWYDLELFGRLVGPKDYFEDEAERGFCPRNKFPPCSPHRPQFSPACQNAPSTKRRRGRLLCCHFRSQRVRHGQKQTHGVRHDLAFTAFNVLAAIKSAVLPSQSGGLN